nr:MAG TPA: hypothetical protein [Caudoviricetes sp.]
MGMKYRKKSINNLFLKNLKKKAENNTQLFYK